MENNSRLKLSGLTKVITVICIIAMIAVLKVPLWSIDLIAPQYPEGLQLKIFPHGLGGDVEVINGLNHYIGMRTLHSEDFPEFTLLPYIIGGYAALGLLVLLFNKRKVFNAWVILFIVIAVTSMVDFYKWEYQYGHELDPDAPIKVPGMSYQPPLIGYKQLLNFSAYSMPDIGGWIFIGVGVLLVLAFYMDLRKDKKMKSLQVNNPATKVMTAMLLFFLTSCSSGPQPIKYGSDNCDFCKMTIVDDRFATQCISTKGKVFRFDDVQCMITFIKNRGVWRNELEGVYFADFENKGQWLKSDVAFLLESETLRSPMGGNIAAFSSSARRAELMKQFNGKELLWSDINPIAQ
jgi:copper chaperone NosL